MTSVKVISNPNLKHFKHSPLPQDKIIYWDTSFALSAILDSPSQRYQHKASVQFLNKLIQEQINIVFSSVLFQEFYRGSITNELIKIYGTKSKADRELDKNPNILKPHIPAITSNCQLFHDLLSKFKGRLFIIHPTEPVVVEEILKLRSEHTLELNDAIHIGTLLGGKKFDIVSFDSHFKNIAQTLNIKVWCRF